MLHRGGGERGQMQMGRGRRAECIGKEINAAGLDERHDIPPWRNKKNSKIVINWALLGAGQP